MKLAEYQVIKLTEQLDRIVAERDQLRAQLAAVPVDMIAQLFFFCTKHAQDGDAMRVVGPWLEEQLKAQEAQP